MGLLRIDCQETRSEILQSNGGVVYARILLGKAGMFRKDLEQSHAFGRELCDEVKERFKCEGFFTSDELPGYGIGREETLRIREAAGAGEKDLILFYAYPEELARAIDRYLMERLG